MCNCPEPDLLPTCDESVAPAAEEPGGPRRDVSAGSGTWPREFSDTDRDARCLRVSPDKAAGIAVVDLERVWMAVTVAAVAGAVRVGEDFLENPLAVAVAQQELRGELAGLTVGVVDVPSKGCSNAGTRKAR
jgi:hypothetical protein